MRKHLKIITIITAVVLTLGIFTASAVFADDTTPGNNNCQGINCQGVCDGDCDGNGNGTCTGDCDGTGSARQGNCYGRANIANGTGTCENGQNCYGRRGI